MSGKLDKSREKIESMFDEIAPAYDRLNHLFTLNIDKKWRKNIVKYLSLRKKDFKTILDLASGTGDLSIELLNLNPEKIIAADISEKMLEIQKIKANNSKIHLSQCEAQYLPFEDNCFDLVTIGFGVRNFSNLEDSLKEINRVLKKDGSLVVLEMFKAGGIKTSLFNFYFGKIMPVIGNKISKSNAYSYLFNSVDNFYNVKEFEGICIRNGFKVEYSMDNFLGIVNTIYFLKN